ncbi:hypothetical protein MRX96_031156 [Rhipicephalus microplus]
MHKSPPLLLQAQQKSITASGPSTIEAPNRRRVRQASPRTTGPVVGRILARPCARWMDVKQAPCGLFARRTTGASCLTPGGVVALPVSIGGKLAEAAMPSFVFFQALDEATGNACAFERITKKMPTTLFKGCRSFRDICWCQQGPPS